MSNLTKKAVLAALNVGGWNARKRDDDAADVVHKHYHASKDSGNYNKCLIDVKHESWKRIITARSALRDFHYARTLPWVHKGAQLLPCAAYLDYNSAVIKLIEEYEAAYTDFIENNYTRLKHAAMRRSEKERGFLGGLYKETDYPSESELRRKFYAEVSYLPVPDSGHIVVDLADEEVARIRADTEAMIEQAVSRAQAELWVRLHEPVQLMAAALADPERRFHDTLVENVRAIVEIAPSMNLTADPKLAAMVASVRDALTQANPETLRSQPDVRAEQARKASALARKMASLMPRAS